MAVENNEGKILLPHHTQQPLCTTRLPYRQGRKLTAVKVYTINNESAHLLIFNVPSLNLRQEIKTLFLRFGKILQFSLTNEYQTDKFTEAYHCCYERIQSARFAKKMLDTRSFYGEILHVCYAPELESISELKEKLWQRQFDVLKRLNSLKRNEKIDCTENVITKQINLDMGIKVPKNNLISSNAKLQSNIGSLSVREVDYENCTEFNSTAIVNEVDNDEMNENFNSEDLNCLKTPHFKHKLLNMGEENTIYLKRVKKKMIDSRSNSIMVKKNSSLKKLEIVDCTSVDKETVTNLNEHLNFDQFGDEIVRKVPVKALNKIKFLNK